MKMCGGLVLRFFFFQAEDGIRDKLVTGVQTCALPISLTRQRLYSAAKRRSRTVYSTDATHSITGMFTATELEEDAGSRCVSSRRNWRLPPRRKPSMGGTQSMRPPATNGTLRSTTANGLPGCCFTSRKIVPPYSL